jgi:parallel beta-helix repeat protein
MRRVVHCEQTSGDVDVHDPAAAGVAHLFESPTRSTGKRRKDMNKRRAILAGVGLVLVIAAGLRSPSQALGTEPAGSLQAGPEARFDGSFAPPRGMHAAGSGFLDGFSPAGGLGVCDGRHREPFSAAPEPRAVRLVPATGLTLIVPDEYETIQAAIEAAAPGDTVYVRAGTYFEHVVLDKQIVLQGEDAASTIIDGGGSGPVVHLTADGLTIQGFTIQHGGMGAPWEWDPTWCGLRTSNVQYARIADCRLTGNAVGMLLSGFSYGTIERCLLSDNHYGILTKDQPDAWENCYNYIIGNVLSFNTHSAIYFTHDPYDGSNLIQGNTISHNGEGIRMWYAWYNEISYNRFLNNEGYGILFDMCICGGYGNVIHHNNFVGNNDGGIQAWECYGPPYEPNYWYSPELNVGNHWSDNTSVDADGDGLGDTPYVIPENGHSDLYPLMNPFVPADMNLDGVVNVFDIDPFVLGLTDPAAYQAQYLVPAVLHGDCNYDGVLNGFDIDPFVQALLSPGEWPLPPNRPPHVPHSPVPDDGGAGVGGPFISWSGGDPDVTDWAVYDVYFEAGNPIPQLLVSSAQTGLIWDTGTLQSNTTYYWQIVARDRYGAETSGPVWSFSTGDEVWSIETIEVGVPYKGVSMATDEQDAPHMCYVGARPFALQYACQVGPEWHIDTIVASGISHGQFALALDSEGTPHVSYRDGGVWYAYHTGSSWAIELVDETSAYTCAIALDSDDHPHIAYVVGSARRLRHAYWDGSTWIIQNLESGVGTSKVAIACDSENNAHICYDVGYTLRYAAQAGGSWVALSIYTGDGAIRGCSLALDADDQPYVSFIDLATKTLRCAMGAGGGWTVETVAVLGYVSSSATSSLRIDSSGRPHIVSVLRHASCGYSAAYLTRPGADWVTELFDAGLSSDAQLCLALDSSDRPHIGYRTGSRVQYARRTVGAEDE